MATIDELVVKIQADVTNLNKNLKKATSMTKRSTKQIKTSVSSAEKAFKKLGATIGIAAIALATKKIATSFIDVGRVLENTQIRLTALLQSAEKGNQLFKDMRYFASTVPFEFEKIIDAAAQLAIVFDDISEINKFMPLLADIAAVTGLTLDQTAQQFVRAFSAGIGAADLFREKGVTAMLGFKAGAKVSVDDTRKAFENALTDMSFKAKDAAKELASTFDGQMSMIRDSIFNIQSQMNDRGSFDGLKANLSLIQLLFKKIEENVNNTNEAIERMNIKSNLGVFIDLLGRARDGIISLLKEEDKIIDKQKEFEDKRLSGSSSERGAIKLGEIIVTAKRAKDELEVLEGTAKDTAKEIEDAFNWSTDSWSDNLADRILEGKAGFKGLGDYATEILRDIARQLLKTQVTTPLANTIGSFATSIFGGITGGATSTAPVKKFAKGGNPQVGVPSIVGEEGPELFVPDTAGTVIPNDKMGGGGNVVSKITINVSPGLQETVRAEIINVAPRIAAIAQNGVFDAIEKGGVASRSVRRKR